MILALYCPRHLDSNDSVFVPLVGFRIMIGNSLSQLTLWCMAKADFQLFNCSLSWWPSNNQIKKVLDLYKRNVSSNFKGWPSSDEILLQKLKLEMKNCSCLKIQQQGRPKYSEFLEIRCLRAGSAIEMKRKALGIGSFVTICPKKSGSIPSLIFLLFSLRLCLCFPPQKQWVVVIVNPEWVQ